MQFRKSGIFVFSVRRNNMEKKYFCAKENGKLHYPHTILTGFGFLASSIAWAIYDPYITKILNALLSNNATINSWSAKLNEAFPVLAEFAKANGENVGSAATGITLVPLFIGIIMTFDNIFGVIFQPTFGKLSDNTHSRFGKRRPYVIFGAPISAILFAIIPIIAIKLSSLPLTMLFIILFVFVMSLWRAPVVALMPDLTPNEIRSEGNAIINLMGGLGSAIGLFAGTVVTAVYCMATGLDSKAPGFDELQTFPYVFLLGAIIMIIGMLVILFFVKEPDSRVKVQGEMNKAADEEARRLAEKEAAKAEKTARKAEKLPADKRKSLVFMLLGLFFLFCGTNAVTTFFALFADEILGKTAAQATIMTTAFAAASAVAAIPAGWLGKKFGRKKTILFGLGIFVVAFGAYLLAQINNIDALTGALIWVALIVGGAANMFITVNTLPLVLEIGGLDKVGTFTGYYYTATFSAQIATPIIYGIVRMLTGTYMSLFYYCPVAFILSALCIFFVKHGEAIPEAVVEKIREENED